MFSDSSTGSWAELQLPCCPSKQGKLPKIMLQKPFTQPAALDCMCESEAMLIAADLNFAAAPLISMVLGRNQP